MIAAGRCKREESQTQCNTAEQLAGRKVMPKDNRTIKNKLVPMSEEQYTTLTLMFFKFPTVLAVTSAG